MRPRARSRRASRARSSSRGSPDRWRSFRSSGAERSPSLWPPEAVELAALALGRAPRTGLADEHPRLPPDDRDRRAVVDQARCGHRGTDALVDDGRHLEDALALSERLDAVADLDRRR